MAPRVHIVTLGVADVARSTAFYARLGAVAAAPSNEHVTFLQLGPVVLALFGRQALAEDAGVPDSAPGFSAVSLAWNQTSESQVDTVFASMVAAGASPVHAPRKVFWGGYSSYVADPDGHLWEIAHNPFFPFDDQGAIQLPA